MKLEKIEIKNYRSLEHLLLDEIGNLTIFIGKNSSGKSNILEAINSFFTEFDADPERKIGNVHRYNWLWHNRVMNEPIEFVIVMDIRDEAREILPEEIVNEFGAGGANELTICRKIIKREDQAVWKTDYVKLNDLFIIRDGAPTIPSETPPEASPETMPGLSSEVVSDTFQKILQNISNAIKGKFKLIQAVRDEKTFYSFGERYSVVPSETQRELTRLDQSTDPEDEKKWIQIQGDYERISENINDFKSIQGNIHAVIRRRKIPLELIGGGDQEVLSLLHPLVTEDYIFGIEEPESHLHPKLSKNLFRAIKIFSEEKQVFVTTHSPFFVDRANLENVKLVTIDADRKTHVEQVSEGNVYKVIEELGIKPSDIFDDDVVIFVEGESDVRIFKAFIATLKRSNKYKKLRDLKIGFIDSEGWKSMKYYANAKILHSKIVEIPVFVVFDGDTEREEEIKKRLVKELDLDESHIKTLTKNSIENYLLVPRALKAAFPKSNQTEKEIQKFFEDNKTKKNKKEVLDLLFKEGGLGKYREIEYGVRIAKEMKQDEIDDEIKDLFKEWLNEEFSESG